MNEKAIILESALYKRDRDSVSNVCRCSTNPGGHQWTQFVMTFRIGMRVCVLHVYKYLRDGASENGDNARSTRCTLMRAEIFARIRNLVLIHENLRSSVLCNLFLISKYHRFIMSHIYYKNNRKI